MGEIVKIQCDICGKVWDPRDKSQFGVLHVFTPALTPDEKGVLRDGMKESRYYICDSCLQKYFNPARSKMMVEAEQSKSKKSSDEHLPKGK